MLQRHPPAFGRTGIALSHTTAMANSAVTDHQPRYGIIGRNAHIDMRRIYLRGVAPHIHGLEGSGES